MNLSLCIILIMCFFVLPLLLWAFFSSFSNQAPETVEISTDFLNALNPELKAKSFSPIQHSEQTVSLTDFKSLFEVPLSHDYANTIYGSIKILPHNGKLFRGYDLWQVILNAGFVYDNHFSKKRFFHYTNDCHSKIIFSLMPLSPPYEFIDSAIGEFETEGLLLLLYDKNERDSMRDIAQLLAEELEGKVTLEQGEQTNITTAVA